MSRKILAVAGVPGTGKTTLFKKFMEQYEWEKKYDEVKLVPYLYCEKLDLIVFGKYDEGEVFAGTDRMSMAAQPEVIKFLKDNTSNILFEGDRLTTTTFYDFLLTLPETSVQFLILNAPDNILQERYEERGSDQSEKFLKGRETKISNIMSNFDYMFKTEILPNSDEEDQKHVLEYVNNYFKTD